VRAPAGVGEASARSFPEDLPEKAAPRLQTKPAITCALVLFSWRILVFEWTWQASGALRNVGHQEETNSTRGRPGGEPIRGLFGL
jgi:hypothetical protein